MKYIGASVVIMSVMTLVGEKSVLPHFDDSTSLFEDIMNEDLFSGYALFNDEEMMNIGSQHSHVRVQEHPTEVEVCIALPQGIKADDIRITVEGNTLSVNAQYKQIEETKRDGAVIKKQTMSSFNIARTLPVMVDEQGVTAVVENDVLKIILPKKTERKKTIKVMQK